ncbi:hypothetical protein [Haladaptatus sp. NG-SE-30]
MVPTDTTQIKQFESYTTGVTVEKSLSISDDGIGVVAIVTDSTHEEPITVQVTDRLPTGFETERIGFHPDDRDHWHSDDGTVVFETSVSATDSVETLYAINETDKTELRRFVGNPEVDVAFDEDVADDVTEDTILSDEPVEAPSASTAEPASEMNTAGDSILTDSPVDTVLGDGPVETSSDDSTAQVSTDKQSPDRSFLMEDAEQVATTESTTDSERTEGETVASTDTSAEQEATSVESDFDSESRDLVAALVAELEAGNLTAHERSVLADHFRNNGDDDPSMNGSVVARLRHVETTVNDLEAYTTALESFLDETGDAQEMVAELEETRATLNTLQTDLSSVTTRLQSVTERVDEFEAVPETVDRLDEQINDVEPTVATLRDHHESMGDRIAALESELESLQTVVGANRSFRESVWTALAENDDGDTHTDTDSSD